MSGVHCQKFPGCMELGTANTVPMCSADDCPGAQGIKLSAMIFAKQEPQTEDEDALAESTAEAMLKLKVEEAERAGRMVERQLRKFLAGALCARCGEALGEDEQIEMDDDEKTCHARCIRDDAAE